MLRILALALGLPVIALRPGTGDPAEEAPDMLSRRDRGWEIVRESLRRERRINDVLNASSAARLSRRVAVAGVKDRAWREAEADLRLIEHEIRRLDPIETDFWDRYAVLERRLVDRFADAGITFETV